MRGVSPANLKFVFDRSYQQSRPPALVGNFHSKKKDLSFVFEFEHAAERLREFLIFLFENSSKIVQKTAFLKTQEMFFRNHEIDY